MDEKKRYVQHISKQGVKWESDWETSETWISRSNGLVLPKSEYLPCDPPETWDDITTECVVRDNGDLFHKGEICYYMAPPMLSPTKLTPHHYRLRKIDTEDRTALVLEQRKD